MAVASVQSISGTQRMDGLAAIGTDPRGLRKKREDFSDSCFLGLDHVTTSVIQVLFLAGFFRL